MDFFCIVIYYVCSTLRWIRIAITVTQLSPTAHFRVSGRAENESLLGASTANSSPEWLPENDEPILHVRLYVLTYE